jgi:DNA repair protein RadD
LILDYTGQDHDLYSPEIEEDKPHSKAVPVEILCPQCGVLNNFWGVKDSEGELIEHYGRKCQGASEVPLTKELQKCGFRFRFKICDQCGNENDIAARVCGDCKHILVDNDKKLKEAMTLKDAHVMKVDSMTLQESFDKKGHSRLEIHYYDVDAQSLKEFFYLNTREDARAFYFNFTRMHNRLPEKNLNINSVSDALRLKDKFRQPLFVIARKKEKYWKIREKIFE